MKSKILLLLVLIAFLFNPFMGKAQVNVQDSLALVDLYDSTGGPGWSFGFGWLKSPVQNWWGVTLDTGGRVTSISLSNFGLKGRLPTSIGNLTKLSYLYLENNQIIGGVPSTFGKLINLQGLYLDNNQLTDSLPSSLGNLKQLRYLHLNNNQLTGSIPNSIVNLSVISELYLNNNQLTGSIPAYLGNYLTGLIYLNLSNNRLSGNIPSSLGGMRYIRELSLSQNQLSGAIPTELGSLSYLQKLNLNKNKLNGQIPLSLGYLSNLQLLNLSYNQLNDSIPAALGNLANLQLLYLNNNYLNSGIPLSLSNLPKAQFVYIDSNYFTFSSLEPLAKNPKHFIVYSPQDTVLPIYLHNQTFTVAAGGTLSNNTYKWYNGSTLVKTTIGDSTYTPIAGGKYSVAVTNTLATNLTLYSDTIAQPLYANTQDSLVLVNLYNSTNGTQWLNKTGWLTGPVSNWYGITLNNYGRVVGVNLASNSLKGAIPTSFGTLSYLTVLNLDSNKLTGILPVSLGNLVNITNLSLCNNQLNDTMPVSLGRLSKLLYLNLSNNQLTGSIPSALGGLASLKTLALNNNRLNNIIPASLGNFSKLSYLSLQHNRFTFYGMDLIAQKYNFATYAPQDTIIVLRYSSPMLFAPGYGTTVNWYNGSTLLSSEFQATPYTVLADGKYSAVITNYNAPKLTLYSDTINIIIKANFADSLILVNFYDSTNGPKWTGNHWLIGPVIRWGGINLNATGRVINISLGYNNLTGSLPTSITNLSKLQTLYLRGNKFSGSIPASFGNFQSLQQIDLSNNNLVDSIPTSIGNLANLQSMDLSYNGISFNIPASFGNLKSLTDLNLSNTSLNGNIPETLGNLKNLKQLGIAHSLLSGSIPASLGNLTNLQSLSLDFVNISGTIPASLGNLTSLQSLSLNNDSISGAIPASLGNLTNLQHLTLSNNLLSGNLPPELGNLTNLQTLSLNNIPVDGRLPAALGNLANLQSLSLNNIAVDGSLPAELGNLTNLTYVNITKTHLSGSIPPSFSKLINLQIFELINNQFSGSIPSFFNKFDELQTLNLSGNYFSDSIPALLAAKNFYAIDLSHNQLTGKVPANLLSLSTGFFNLSYNKLTGTFPTFLQNNYNLYDFNISHNYFTFKSLVPLNNVIATHSRVLAPQDTVLPLHFFNKALSVSIDSTIVGNTYKWYRNDTLVATKIGDSTYIPTTYGRYFVGVSNYYVYSLTLHSDTLTIGDSLILPTRPAAEYASYEYTDTAGWTHYYYNNNTPNDLTDDTLLLSLKKNGQNIGSIGDGTFTVKLVATAAAGSNAAVKLTNPLITNSTGYWVMNRYWQVTPTHEPANSVGVRFYYNNQDLADVNGSYPAHNLTNNKLIFYKAIGGNPDPTSNLAGATNIISIMPGTKATDTTWTYHALSDTTQYGEYSVASFSGGGGGGTGNNQALPVVLVNFTGNLAKNDVQLNWQTAQEVNAGYYTVERSLTGRDYTAVGRINAAGNSTITQAYKLTDYNAALLGSATLYYRLKITDKNGYTTYSNVIAVNIAGGVSGLLVYPNPAKNIATVIFYANAVGKYAVEVTDLGGRIIKRMEGRCAVGLNKVSVNVQGYSQGSYMVTVVGDNIKRQSIILMKQ